MGFREGFIYARSMSKLTQAEIRDKLEELGCDVTIGTVSRWERGIATPSLQNFFALCKIFDIDNPLEVFSDFYTAKLNAEGLQKVQEYRYDMILTGRYEPKPKGLSRIPLYLLPASAGTGQLLDGNDYEWLETDEPIPAGADFAIRIAGDSMEPQFHNGDNVFVHKQVSLEDGEIGIFFLDGDAYIKKLHKTKDGIQLVSLNTAYEPIRVSEGSELRVYGKVL